MWFYSLYCFQIDIVCKLYVIYISIRHRPNVVSCALLIFVENINQVLYSMMAMAMLIC